MSTEKTYKVTFKGVIYPGFDKDLVIKNIHNITRIPESTIARKFFSGKTVVIRHADSQDYANHLQKTFARAGIETYIAEIYDTRDSEEPSASDLNNITHNNKSKPEKGRTLKLIYAVTGIIVIVVLTGYFLIAEPEATNKIVKPNPLPVEIKPVEIKKAPAKNNAVTIISKKETIKPLSSLLTTDNITLLIKITDISGLKYLSNFVHLSELSPEVIDILKETIKSENSSLITSEESPLYLFQTDSHSGLFISKKHEISNELITQIKSKISLEHNINTCSKSKPVKLINTKNHLLLINNNDPAIGEQIKYLSNNNYLNKQFLEFNSLFAHKESNFQASFDFYYSDKLSNVSVSANPDSFWFNSAPNVIDNQLLQHLTIIKNQPDSLSSLKDLNLYQLTLLLITQNKADSLFTDKSHDINFKPETIITLNKNYSAKSIKNYQSNLDIEFNAQWQSGPFAISTNKFIFDKKISIELLAKGQNIENLMEYSCAASINTESVLNNNDENILLKNCADKPLNKVCFKNHDGELEAYIDNDFVSYTSISAANKITLKADSMISDIKQINGTITLQLADEILNKSFNFTKLQNSEQQKIQQFEHFAIQFQTHDQKSSLKYNIIGDINRFITLRGYNKSGEILDTVLFKRKKIINNQITVHLQEFSEDIDHIKVFYTNRNNKLTFPFALKPSIVPGKIPLDGDDIEETGFIMTGDKNMPEFSSLGDAILQDNPDWLGENKAQTRLLPFYISFFAQNETDNMHDAVLNIKSALSPYISQNLSAVRVILNDKQNTLIDNFVSFTTNEYIDEEQSINSDGSIMAPKIMAYLNSNSAFQIHKNNIDELHGELTFNLPAVFKTHSSQYFPSGQSIKTDDLMLTLTQIDKHQVQFKIKGNIAKIVQLKLYNKQEKLISEPFEFKIINKNTALLTLRYTDQIDSIKLVLSQETLVKNYIFSLKK